MSSSKVSPTSEGCPPTLSLPQSGGRGPVAHGAGSIPAARAPSSPSVGEGWGGGAPVDRLSRRFLLIAPLVLAACGFTPAYAPGGAATALLGTVYVQDPGDRNGFDLVERLEERLGRTTETLGVGFTADNQITRYNLKGVIDYTLTDRASGARVTGGRVQNFTAYSATGSTVAGLAAEEDAGLRLMRILADQIVVRLVAALASQP
ncbi:MAG: hypothetical protein B7Z04_05920 [Rhodobacterales bacterium 32-66-9]|nr:MAG: hypothetical protein B7Z04_05920 [Rhodobacterales bacterium 32-66-9]